MKALSLVLCAALALGSALPATAAPLKLEAMRTSIDLDQYEPDTIVVSTQERRLYYKTQEGQVLTYPVGVGRDSRFTWSGTHTVTQMKEWPDWVPPPDMLKRQPYLPRYVKGGPGNPLGARALYIGNTIYRIHGSDQADTVGQAVSSGCFRMKNKDVVNLYARVRVGTKVVVFK